MYDMSFKEATMARNGKSEQDSLGGDTVRRLSRWRRYPPRRSVSTNPCSTSSTSRSRPAGSTSRPRYGSTPRSSARARPSTSKTSVWRRTRPFPPSPSSGRSPSGTGSASAGRTSTAPRRRMSKMKSTGATRSYPSMPRSIWTSTSPSTLSTTPSTRGSKSAGRPGSVSASGGWTSRRRWRGKV